MTDQSQETRHIMADVPRHMRAERMEAMTEKDAALLPVTQADRLKPMLLDWMMLKLPEKYRQQIEGNIERGEYDGMPLHDFGLYLMDRLAHEAGQRDRVAELTEELEEQAAGCELIIGLLGNKDPVSASLSAMLKMQMQSAQGVARRAALRARTIEAASGEVGE